MDAIAAASYLLTPTPPDGFTPIQRLRTQIDQVETLGGIVPEPETRRAMVVLREAKQLPGLLVMLTVLWDLHEAGKI